MGSVERVVSKWILDAIRELSLRRPSYALYARRGACVCALALSGLSSKAQAAAAYPRLGALHSRMRMTHGAGLSSLGLLLSDMNFRVTEQTRDASDPRSERVFLQHLEEIKSAGGQSYYNHRFLGRGGNGTAFLVTAASGPNAGMQFALKVLHRLSDEQRRNAFTREVKRLNSLNHPAIVRMFDEGALTRAEAEHPFVVMEYIPMTIRMLMARKELDRLGAIRAGLHCLSALSYLHSRQPAVIHRDIKPENILLSDGTAKLADFGLAKELIVEDLVADADGERVEDVHGLSQWPGMPVRYRTPELVARARGEQVELTTRTDIYQLGTVLYELLTGSNPQRVSKHRLDDIVLDVRSIRGASGDELTNLVREMTARTPADRPDADMCLRRLDVLHRDVCRQLMRVEGMPV